MAIGTQSGKLLIKDGLLQQGCECCEQPTVVVCTDCCPELLDPSVIEQKSIVLDFDLSFSANCSGQSYSASVNESATAFNRAGCPFGPLCSQCIFVASFAPQDAAICNLTAIIEIAVQNGICIASINLQPSIRGSSWGLCNSQQGICPGFGIATSGFFFNAFAPSQQFYSASGCMGGVEFPFDTTSAGFLGNTVATQGTVSVVTNPLP